MMLNLMKIKIIVIIKKIIGHKRHTSAFEFVDHQEIGACIITFGGGGGYFYQLRTLSMFYGFRFMH